MGGDAGGDVRECKLPKRFRPHAVHQNRHPFAGVIRAGPSRVIAVVGGDDLQVVGAEFGQQLAEFCVKPF